MSLSLFIVSKDRRDTVLNEPGYFTVRYMMSC